MDDERLKNPNGHPDYFDELLERIRDIKASEKRFHQKLRDLFKLSSDYDTHQKATQMFFAETQNKLLYAVTHHTATELIASHANSSKPNMGLTSWKGTIVRLQDIMIAKNYLEKERKKSGIKNLKIKYNRLNGYFLEVTHGSLKTAEIPEHFIRRRSLASSDRFTTEALSKLETKLNDVSENIIACEKELFFAVHTEVYNRIELLHLLAKEIAELDVLQSFAYSAALHAWVKPEFSADGLLDIREGRHPVVEYHLPTGEFVPNSIRLSSAAEADIPSFALITGPNMAGKSTFLRQTALITLLAQVGSFVPAEKALLTPVDCIFCRVGASDNLARGESTFLVEMTETAYILRNASVNSLVIMDEIGRGTSTGDGLSIARAVSEYLLHTISAKTLFATHYHELAQLIHPRLQKLCLDVLETEGKIVFLKKVIEGIAAHSYGVHVAELAGLPETVIQRATELLKAHIPADAASTDFTVPEKKKTHPENTLFSDEELIINEILSIDTDETTPLQALQMLTRWKKILFSGN